MAQQVVVISTADWQLAYQTACGQVEVALAEGFDGDGRTPRQRLFSGWVGYCAEAAFRRFSGLPWDPEVLQQYMRDRFRKADVGGYQVRGSVRWNAPLRVYERDQPHPYVLLCRAGTSWQRWRLAGWLPYEEAWAQVRAGKVPRSGPFAKDPWLVPQLQLRPMERKEATCQLTML